MGTLNPYAGFLDGRPLETILAATSAAISSQLQIIGAEKSTISPAPGKWSAAEIICHLADCELVFAFRLRQTLAEPTTSPRTKHWTSAVGRYRPAWCSTRLVPDTNGAMARGRSPCLPPLPRCSGGA